MAEIPCAHEALHDAAYVHDGSLEGILSAVFLAYERKEEPGDIVDEALYEPRLDQSVIFVQTDLDRALRVRRGLERAAGTKAFRCVLQASLCDDYNTGMVIYRFIRLAMDREKFKSGGGLIDDLACPQVAALMDLRLRAVNEAEKMRQFVRFSHMENGIWFARCNPNVSVIPLVIGHFAARFNDQPFIIYDENHRLSGIYDGSSWQLVPGVVEGMGEATSHDELMQEAWRCFYDALCVDARYNPELRRNFMPQRLWKNLPEMLPSRGRQMSRAS